MTTDAPPKEAITGVILAGGRARRLGGQDKGLLPFRGRPLVAWVIDALAPQVGRLAISANRNRKTYAAYGHPVIADASADFQGPLAGIASAMATVTTPWILILPCDAPFPAPDLKERLGAALCAQGAEIAVACDDTGMQPIHALIPIALAPSLDAFLASGQRKVARWYSQHAVALADLSDRPACFRNINRQEDAELLARMGKT